MDATFRIAIEQDAAAILAMMRTYYELDGIAFEGARAERGLRGLLASPAWGAAYVIEQAHQVVGYLVVTLGYSLEYGGVDAFLDELFVVEAHRRRGIGTASLHFAQRACRELGARALHLEVERHNPRARALYQRMGFEEHDRFLMTRWLER